MSTDIKHRYHIIAFSNKGITLMQNLAESLQTQEHADVITYDTKAVKAFGGVSAVAGIVFHKHLKTQEALVFIGAAGIAVRAIASHVADKLTDPPVVCIDDEGHFVISLLSGHLGNANVLAKSLSMHLTQLGYSNVPVITTATDVRGVEGFESILRRFRIDIAGVRHDIKRLNMAIANGETIGLYIDPSILMKTSAPLDASDAIKHYEAFDAFAKHSGLKVIIALHTCEYWQTRLHALTDSVMLDAPETKTELMIYHSRALIVGTGCRKDVSPQDYFDALHDALASEQYAEQAIDTFASITLKADEKCIRRAAEQLKAETHFFTPEILESVEHLFEGSDFVKATTGVKAVAGPSAFIITQDEMTYKIFKGRQCTFSFGRLPL